MQTDELMRMKDAVRRNIIEFFELKCTSCLLQFNLTIKGMI